MSDETGVFYKLARSISQEERSDLLERLSSRIGEGADPLIPEQPSDVVPETAEEHYQRMGIIQKFILFLKSLFTQRNIHDLVEDMMIDRIARRISSTHPDIFHHKTTSLGNGFLTTFDSLRKKLMVLHEPLRVAFSSDRKDFVAFLGTALLPLEHDKLARASNPEEIAQRENSDEFELKKRVQMATRELLTNIDKDAKSHMYSMYRALLFLYELISLPTFRTGFGGAHEVIDVDASRFKKPLTELANTLYSLRVKPSKSAIEAVLLFPHKDKPEQDDDFETRFKAELEGANSALQELQSFCRLPIVEICKVLTRNPAYEPNVIGGGEDWFSHYRQYWEDIADQNLVRYADEQKVVQFRSESETLLGNGNFARLRGYCNEEENAYHVRYGETAMYLLRLSEHIFLQKAGGVLKTFLVNGEFYKTQNREEFTDAFNGISDLRNSLRNIDSMLLPESDIVTSIARIQNDKNRPELREKRIQDMVSRVDTAMEDLVRVAIDHLESLINVTKGILYGQSGGAFDTLVNIQTIGGSDNQNLRRQLDTVLNELVRGKKLLHVIYDFEKHASK